MADADKTPSVLRRRIPSLRHDQLLSAKRSARHATESRSVSRSRGTGAPPLPFRSRWLRGYARARSSVVQRTRARRSLGGDEGPQTVLRPGGWRTHPNRGCPIRRGFRRMGTAKAGTVGFVAGLTVATTSSPFSTALHNKNPDSCDEQPLLRTQERANSPYARVLHRQELLQVRS